MQTRTILVVLAAVIAASSLPMATLAAQQRGGFVGTINPGFVGSAAGLGVGQPVAQPGFGPNPGQHYPGSSLTPYFPAHGGPTRPATPLPSGVSVTTPRHPRSRYVRPGSYVSVAPPQGTRVAPGHEIPATEDTGVRTGRPAVPPEHGRPYPPVQPLPVLVPVYPYPVHYPVHSTSPLPRHAPRHYPITLGMPRADVLLYLGTPRVTILRPGKETLVFSNHTIVLEDGVVAVIR